MRGPTNRFFAVAVLCAGLFAGCEWTSSDSESSWSGSYDDMNFSGTYRTGISYLPAESGGAGNSAETVIKTRSEKIATISGDRKYSGTLKYLPIEPGSVSVEVVGNFSYSDAGNGSLVGDTGPAGNGTINYAGGGWSITIMPTTKLIGVGGSINASYSYYENAAGGGSVGPEGEESLKSITVTQTGQRLTMIFSNGLTMTGQFTQVNESGGGEGGTTHNAGFEVSSSGNKFVGTLSSSIGKRVINGTWISGKSHYDVSGTAN